MAQRLVGESTAVTYDPYSAAMHADPYETYRYLREEAPLYYNAEREFWALSRYEDVRNAERDWETFSYAHGNDIDHTGDVYGPGNFLDADPPKHTILRNLVRRAFNPRELTEQMAAPVSERVEELLGEQIEAGTADFADQFAWRLPVTTACVFLGIPREDELTMEPWAKTSSLREAGVTHVPEVAMEAFGRIESYLADALAERRRNPQEDLLTHIAAAEIEGKPIEDAVATGISLILFVASIETTASLLSNAIMLLGEHPGQRDALAADPGQIPAAVEEVLRYESPLQVFSRCTTREVELYGETIPEGGRVFVVYGAANRDERKFEDAESFDITRPAKRHLAFGDGIHHCLGAPLARLEAKIALEAIVSRAPQFELAGGSERLCNHGIRGFVKLPVRWD